MSGFQSPNYTQTPNDLFDELLPEMGLAELKVVMCIVRHTFGYHKEKVSLSLRAIARFTGLTAKSVMEGATQAESHGLIVRHQDGQKSTVWEAIVSVIPATTRRDTRYHKGVPSTTTQSGVKEKNKEKENTSPLSEEDYKQVNKEVDAILEAESKARFKQEQGIWMGRELTPNHLLPYADWWNSVSGQVMKKGKINNDWMHTFTKWYDNDVTLTVLDEAYQHEKAWKQIIAKPHELTGKAIAIQALPKPNENTLIRKEGQASGYFA